MKEFLHSTKGKICIACVALLLVAALAGGGYGFWHYQQPKFQDVTIELGQPLPQITAFLTEYAHPDRATLETPEQDIDLSRAGQQSLTFSHGGKEETVVLHIVDTTVPQVSFREVIADVDAVLTPEDFVESVFDLSEVQIAFAQPLNPPESYGDATAMIVVTDASGNTVTAQCKIRYVWMYAEFTLELGQRLQKADVLMNPEKDSDLLTQEELDAISDGGPGTYTITGEIGDVTCQCVVTVVDTTAPALELQDVSVYADEGITLEAFLVSWSDASQDVTIEWAAEPDLTTAGYQTVTIVATDASGNVTTAEAGLTVLVDTQGPVFSGMGQLSVYKNGTVDYAAGITANDERDGEVEFTYDASKVDLSTAGTYYVIYTATDASGNVTTFRRKVVVSSNTEDTAALVAQIAASLPADAVAILNYVKNNIGYNHSWGGTDPVWYGFTNKVGNCYVHALCLQELLAIKGFETQLIWVEGSSPGSDKAANGWDPHYWLIVKLDGVWWHIDATPGRLHSKYPLMNDEMRYETLKSGSYQRDWDRSLWPVCDGETP